MPFDHAKLLNPPVGRAAYSDRTAWIMAECSALAYVKFETDPKNEIEIRSHLKNGGFELRETFDKEGTQGFLAQRTAEDFAVLAFRGTESNFRDILTDLKTRFYQNPKGAKIHRGFSQAYRHVEAEVTAAAGRLNPRIPLYITGHSLGGALATVACMRISPDDRIAACYTFGSPRVGDAEFEQQLWKVPVYRVTHAADIVPRVPLIFMGFRHVGDHRYVTRNGNLLRSPAQIRLLFRFVFSLIQNWRSIFQDHGIANYVEKLAEWAKKRQ